MREKPKLIILRGNSGSGKTTVAKRLQKELGNGTLLLSQDVIRREVLYVNDGPETQALGLLKIMLQYGFNSCERVILEGIFNRDWYHELFVQAKSMFNENIHAYYFDIPFEETLIRHHTKPNAHEFGETQMKSWWREKDYLKMIPEKSITKEMSVEEAVRKVLEDMK